MLFLGDDQLARVLADDSYPRDAIRQQVLTFTDKRWMPRTAEEMLAEDPGRSQCSWSAYVGDLSLAFRLSDDERYVDTVLEFLRLLAQRWRKVEFLPHIHIPFAFCMVAQFLDLQGDRVAEADQQLLHRFMAEMMHDYWPQIRKGDWAEIQHARWNHNIIGFSTLAIASQVLHDNRDAAQWFDLGMERTDHFLDVGVTAAGMTWEGLHYCGYVFKHVGLLLQMLRNQGRLDQLAPAGSEHERRLHQVPNWYAHDTYPRGLWLQNYNDSHCDPYSPLYGFLMAFADFEPDVCAAVWEKLVGRSGLGTYGAHYRWSSLADSMLYYPLDPPDLTAIERLDPHFYCPEIGYVSTRDHWGADGSVFTFNSGPLIGVVHDHSDNNSFTFIAEGEPLVIEAGSANKPVEGSGSSATGHNLVFIDGVSEALSGGARGVDGTILGVDRTDHHVAVVGDATASYNKEGHNPVRHALRHAVFVKQPVPYLITYDDIDKDGDAHLYEYLLHVPFGDDHDDAKPVGRLTVGKVLGEVAGGVVLARPAMTTVATQPFTTQAAPFKNHVLWRIAHQSVNPGFLMVFVPARLAIAAPPGVTIETSSASTKLRLRWPHGTDELVFSVRAADGAVPLPALTQTPA
jgi:hypothetical protein